MKKKKATLIVQFEALHKNVKCNVACEPIKFQGLDLPDPCVSQSIAHVEALINRRCSERDLTGKFP
jgi:hypothetical protein